jgi:hypothetical protein
MPNLGFQLEVLKQTVTERAATGDPLATSLSQNNFDNALMPFAVLGAMGPDVLRYTPISATLASFLSSLIPSATSGTAMTPSQITAATQNASNALTALTAATANEQQTALAWELSFNPLGAIYSVLFSSIVVPVWPMLANAISVLDQLDGIVQSQNTFALLGMLGTLQNLQSKTQQLVGLSGTIAVLQTVIGTIVAEGPWMEMGSTQLPPADPVFDRRYEFLRWHHTGDFVRNLVAGATSQNQKAFVFGWQSHVAASVTSEPFINNIVGGPYRTHWQRNRLAGNYVDAWTFGFFEQPTAPALSGDNPTPPYFDPTSGNSWPSICTANLQNLFNVAGVAAPQGGDVSDAVQAMASGDFTSLTASAPFPAEISTLLNGALAATYTQPLGSTVFPSLTLPIVGISGSTSSPTSLPAFANDTFANAFYGAFAVYWFMTSGVAVTAENPAGTPTGQPEPSWVTNGSSPSPQQAGLSVGGAICAVILAVASLVLLLTGNLPLGVTALLAAINAPIVDWGTVANESFWIRKNVVDQENALRDVLVLSGLAYPPPVWLGAVDPNGNTWPTTDLTPPQLGRPTGDVPTTAGVPLCKTNALTLGTFLAAASYPLGLDTSNGPADDNYDSFPINTNIGAEQPTTDNVIGPGLYPNAMILSGAAVQNGGVLAGGGNWPTVDQSFGDAVANAVQIISTNANSLPNYNLDADRGYGWQTWDPAPASNPANPPVVVQQEP